MHEKAKLPYINAEEHDGPAVGLQGATSNLSYFPGLPKHRDRGNYKQDQTKTAGRCNKEYRGHPSLLPGVFTVFCQHGTVYEFFFFSLPYFFMHLSCKNILTSGLVSQVIRSRVLLLIEIITIMGRTFFC